MQSDVEKFFEEGVHLYEQEKLDEAETKFLEALKLDSNSDEIKYNLALVYLEKKEYDKTNFMISQIKDIECDEIIDELEKVEIDVGHENPISDVSQNQPDLLQHYIEEYIEKLNDEYLPQKVKCEYCDSEIEMSETERQTKYYKCPICKNDKNIRENERLLENEFHYKPDSELFEILVESENFKLEYLFAAKREIKRRNIILAENEDFRSALNQYL